MSVTPAWDRLAQEEASAVAHLLERDDRRVLVIVVATDGDNVDLVQGVSQQVRRSHGQAFVQALRRRADQLDSLLKEPR